LDQAKALISFPSHVRLLLSCSCYMGVALADGQGCFSELLQSLIGWLRSGEGGFGLFNTILQSLSRFGRTLLN